MWYHQSHDSHYVKSQPIQNQKQSISNTSHPRQPIKSMQLHKPLIQPMHPMSTFQQAETVLDLMIEELILDVCISQRWNALKSKSLIIHDKKESMIANKSSSNATNLASSSSGGEQPKETHRHGSVSCPICHQFVGGTRFAPHLEKCMKISKKTNFIELPSTTKKSRPIIDPHPKSLIIRIKLDKNGVPTKNKIRIGATIEEFNSNKEDNS